MRNDSSMHTAGRSVYMLESSRIHSQSNRVLSFSSRSAQRWSPIRFDSYLFGSRIATRGFNRLAQVDKNSSPSKSTISCGEVTRASVRQVNIPNFNHEFVTLHKDCIFDTCNWNCEYFTYYLLVKCAAGYINSSSVWF